MMKRFGAVPLCFAGVLFLLASSPLHGQESRPRYRDFILGSRLSAVSAQVNVPASEAVVLHERPALLQELKWRQPYFLAGSNKPQTDPVRAVAFSFYDDQLFKMTIEYDRERTKGLSDGDLIAALSETYGPATKPTPRVVATLNSNVDIASGSPIAAWVYPEYSVVLYRSSFGDGFQVVVTSTALDALARSAAAEAVRQDQRDAPARAAAQQQKTEEDARVSLEKARTTNKAAFRP